MSDQKNQYEVVWPLGKSCVKKTTLAPRLDELEGKTILELSHYSYRGDDIFPALRESIKKRYKNVKFLDYDTLGNFRDPRNFGGYELEKAPNLNEILKKYNVDAVIAGVGA